MTLPHSGPTTGRKHCGRKRQRLAFRVIRNHLLIRISGACWRLRPSSPRTSPSCPPVSRCMRRCSASYSGARTPGFTRRRKWRQSLPCPDNRPDCRSGKFRSCAGAGGSQAGSSLLDRTCAAPMDVSGGMIGLASASVPGSTPSRMAHAANSRHPLGPRKPSRIPHCRKYEADAEEDHRDIDVDGFIRVVVVDDVQGGNQEGDPASTKRPVQPGRFPAVLRIPGPVPFLFQSPTWIGSPFAADGIPPEIPGTQRRCIHDHTAHRGSRHTKSCPCRTRTTRLRGPPAPRPGPDAASDSSGPLSALPQGSAVLLQVLPCEPRSVSRKGPPCRMRCTGPKPLRWCSVAPSRSRAARCSAVGYPAFRSQP